MFDPRGGRARLTRLEADDSVRLAVRIGSIPDLWSWARWPVMWPKMRVMFVCLVVSLIILVWIF